MIWKTILMSYKKILIFCGVIFLVYNITLNDININIDYYINYYINYKDSLSFGPQDQPISTPPRLYKTVEEVLKEELEISQKYHNRLKELNDIKLKPDSKLQITAEDKEKKRIILLFGHEYFFYVLFSIAFRMKFGVWPWA